jgi:hypothetical protein
MEALGRVPEKGERPAGLCRPVYKKPAFAGVR